MAEETKTVGGSEGMKYPTPVWFRTIIRGCLWITGLYALISINVDFKDFGVSVATENLILKYMAVFSTLVSIVGRFIGEKPIDFRVYQTNTTDGQYVIFDAATDTVTKFNGLPLSPPYPDVPTWANNNGMSTILNDGPGYYKLLYVSSDEPFTIVIQGQLLNSTGFAGGRPPLRPR